MDMKSEPCPTYPVQPSVLFVLDSLRRRTSLSHVDLMPVHALQVEIEESSTMVLSEAE